MPQFGAFVPISNSLVFVSGPCFSFKGDIRRLACRHAGNQTNGEIGVKKGGGGGEVYRDEIIASEEHLLSTVGARLT